MQPLKGTRENIGIGSPNKGATSGRPSLCFGPDSISEQAKICSGLTLGYPNRRLSQMLFMGVSFC